MHDRLTAPVEASTARLRLRRPKLEDAGRLFHAYARDQDSLQFLTSRAHETEDEMRQFLRQCLDEWSSGAGFPYVIEIGNEAVGPVGMIHLHNRRHFTVFGFVIARPYWGRGYMTEALSTLVDWSLDQPQIWRASASCDIDNLASARVMAKAGMTFEGILHRYSLHPNISAEPRDCRVFAKVRS